MRVLHIENNSAFGGSLTGLLDLIEHLPGGVQPILVCSFDAERFVTIPRRCAYQRVEHPRYDWSPAHPLRRLWRYYWQIHRHWTRLLEDLVRRERPDVIHGNNSCMSNLAAATVARRHGIPAISHQKCFEYPGRVNRWLLQYSPYTFHIGTSPAISRNLLSLGLPQAKLTTMFEPIRPPENWRLAARREVPVIGMHSMLTPWKGQDVFLRAVGILKRTYSGPFRVVVAGSAPGGDEEFPRKLRQIAVEEGIADLVDFRGHVSDVYGLLPEFDIAVHAAVAPEPFGRVVAEAMICGVPVLVSDAGGPADYVQHGVTGLHVPMGNAQAMAETLAGLLDDPAQRQAMGMAGREFALAAFDPVRLGQEMAEFYEQLVAGKAAARRRSTRAAVAAGAG
jgi:glycosyltransferase involved in cell wall biosynthesis